TLVVASATPDADFQFGVVENEQPNAVSTPNGAVFVTTGSIRRMRDEAELAGVLAHEITHVMQNHGLKAVGDEMRKGALVRGLNAASNSTARFSAIADFGADTFINKGFSKEAEREADAGAVGLCKQAGYDPAGLLRFLERLEKESPSSGAST